MQKEWIPPTDGEEIQMNLESIKGNIEDASKNFLFGSLSDIDVIEINCIIDKEGCKFLKNK